MTNDTSHPTLGQARTYRAAVLGVLAASSTHLSARTISHLAGITYEQTIFALHGLHCASKVHRQGHKATAMWGNICLKPPGNSGYLLLESLFHAIVKR